MLVLTRRPGQAITIQPALGVDLAAPVGALFAHGPIEVRVNRIEEGRVKIGITAHTNLVILRDELTLRSPFRLNPVANVSSMSSGRDRLARSVFGLRMQQHLSVKQLADTSQIPFRQLCDIESGTTNVGLEDLEKLAIALGTDIAELFRSDGL